MGQEFPDINHTPSWAKYGEYADNLFSEQVNMYEFLKDRVRRTHMLALGNGRYF